MVNESTKISASRGLRPSGCNGTERERERDLRIERIGALLLKQPQPRGDPPGTAWKSSRTYWASAPIFTAWQEWKGATMPTHGSTSRTS